jgi:hypothetical protein
VAGGVEVPALPPRAGDRHADTRCGGSGTADVPVLRRDGPGGPGRPVMCAIESAELAAAAKRLDELAADLDR